MTDRSVTALVEFQIRAEQTTLDDWLRVWAARADDAHRGEPETLAYEAAVSLDNDLNVLVFERYRHGDSSLKRHMDRPAHATLTETMGERRMTRRRVMSVQADDVDGFGWWRRDDRAACLDAAGGGDGGTVVTVLGMRFAHPDMRAAFIELSAAHADYCLANEPGTLTYSGGVVGRDSDRGDFRAGDVLFVMECTDLEATDTHANDPQHLALGGKLEARGVELEATFLQTYRTTGLGFMCR